MTDVVHVDFETRSDVDLRTEGAFRYFESPHTKVLICCWQMKGRPPRRWTYRDPPPQELLSAIRRGVPIKAWNAQFESLGFDLMADRCGWPRPKLEQFVDTAAAASAMALPRSLDKTAAALGLDAQKDKDGRRLINKFSKPRKPRKDEDPGGIYWNEPEEHAEDFETFVRYCEQDVATEAAADARLVPLSDREQAYWVLHERINRRGIRVDTRSLQASLVMAQKASRDLDRKMSETTHRAVTATTQVARLTAWVGSQGVDLASAAKADISDLLETTDLPDHVREALELRQAGAKTSVSKLAAFQRRANADGRIRGAYIYHAASTGRTQSVGVNLNNLPRPRPLFDNAHLDRGTLFRAIRSGDPDLLPLLYGDDLGKPLHLLSDAIRGFLWAAPGHEFIQADYSSIESVVIAWLAGEEWKVQAFRDIQADPSLPDMYRRTAAQIMGTTTDVIDRKHPLRQGVGKPAELGLGFGGGVAAFYTFARGYGVDLEAIAPPVLSAASEGDLEKAAKRYENEYRRGRSRTNVLSREAWMACEIIKIGWRRANSAIRQSWYDLEHAVREAVANPGTVTGAAKVQYTVRNGFLWALLPSGRCLAYGAPRLNPMVWAKVRLGPGEWSDAEPMDRDAAQRGERRGEVKIEGRTSDKVTVLGVDSATKAWRRFGLYGGLLAENNTQAVARDILRNGMEKAEAANYPIVATVYDEIIAEVPRGFGDLGAFERLICETEDWAEGLPVSAGGWRGKRYRKE